MKSLREAASVQLKRVQSHIISYLQKELQHEHNIAPQVKEILAQDIAPRVKGILNQQYSISARYWPYMAEEQHWLIPKSTPANEVDAEDGLPIPPPSLWAGYGTNSTDYILSGRSHFAAMLEQLSSSGFALANNQRILELGCAAGRLLRNFKSAARHSEVWGTDLSASHIVWCRQNLSPPFRFFTNTTFPHLPIEDNYFDLIYAASIFTHIGDLEDAWLMELRRITRPGGYLYITVHDNRAIDVLMSAPPGHWLHGSSIQRELLEYDQRAGFRQSGFDIFLISRAPGNTQVFHDLDYIRKHWGTILEIAAVVPEGSGYQTAIILKKSS